MQMSATWSQAVKDWPVPLSCCLKTTGPSEPAEMKVIGKEISGTFYFLMVGYRAALTGWISSVRSDDLMKACNRACSETAHLPLESKRSTQRERKSYKCSIQAFQHDNYRAWDWVRRVKMILLFLYSESLLRLDSRHQLYNFPFQGTCISSIFN